MKTHALLALVGLATGFITPAFTQTTIPKELVGTWTIVSITQEQDGKKIDLFGPNPQGRRIIDADGHVFYIVTRGDLPKFASNNRAAGTPEENKAVVQGSIAFFGTVTADEADKTYTQHIEVCSFPNWIGDHKSTYTINGDELIATTSGSSVSEGTVRVVYKRTK
jgi:lipocalin-like protein